MPINETLKLEGTKLVPINRFNLEPAKPSNSFATDLALSPAIFTVVEHPIIRSINLMPLVVDPINIIEYFPLINNSEPITEGTVMKAYQNDNLHFTFPVIELLPLQNTIFYYEEVLDKEGNVHGYFGTVSLSYQIKDAAQNIKLNFKEVVLNLKVRDEIIKISGTINADAKEIYFKLKDEAVKIAFLNLVSNINELKCSVELYFEFKGYSKSQKKMVIAKRDFSNLIGIPVFNRRLPDFKLSALPEQSILSEPLFLKEVPTTSSISASTLDDNQPESKLHASLQEEFIKSTFILKVSRVINYPLVQSLDNTKSLYKTISGGFTNNPFNLNDNFSQFQQIFVPGVNFDKLSIYKSAVQPNTFLLIAKKYYIARTNDTMKPCITTVFHAVEEGTSLSEDISKISFQFAIGPDLSNFDLAKLKIDLLNNNFLDAAVTNSIDNIQFLYPNDVEAAYEISGNHFLQTAEISTDGKYFNFMLTTTNLNTASLLINALNNSISQYANLNFRHKEIKDSCTIDLNIEKTIGELLTAIIDNDNKTIKFENKSLSKCKLNGILCIFENNMVNFNSTLFNKFPLLTIGKLGEIKLNDFAPSNLADNVKKIYCDFDSIEDISAEFEQIVSKTTNYNRYIQIQIQKQHQKVNKIQLELLVFETGNTFGFEKIKSTFSIPILFNFIIKNSQILNTQISYKIKYFDVNDNIIKIKEDNFNYSSSSIIRILKHNL